MEALAAKKEKGAKYLLVNIEGATSIEAAKGFKAKHNLKHVTHLLLQSASVPSAYAVKYIPHHVVIGKDGKVKITIHVVLWRK